uniref:HAT C-terminal dimerisation domain-containing protein n=1 Tax=Cannabis sativa TaxID=3483 RepID=A0A803QNX9_CANSA
MRPEKKQRIGKKTSSVWDHYTMLPVVIREAKRHLQCVMQIMRREYKVEQDRSILRACGEKLSDGLKKLNEAISSIRNALRYVRSSRLAEKLQLSDDIEEDDLEYYLNDRSEKLDPTLDILQWWKRNGFKYPGCCSYGKGSLGTFKCL